ncbi:MAG: T9SS type A sorting domain-containing protein [Bacteroidia bacterium]|nr:T9SS type A sorting domain-containing protein [Bacteroidia bacterium]
MKKLILFISLITASIFPSKAQDYEWAYTSGQASISNVAAIRKDHDNNFYFASQRDTFVTHLYSDLEKRDNNQQLLWTKHLSGEVFITDLEINSANNVVVIGYYMDSVSLDGITLTNSSFLYSGFIFEADENGNLLWLHDINAVNDEFKPIELFIAQNGFMYITTEISGITNDFTSFHKLDLQGNIIQSEFNNNTEVRTYTNILADNEGNVYLSGTCGNFATFDTIDANINYSYQNFVIKYDSSFNAQWFHSRDYITFDHNNSLQTNGQSLFWSFVDYTNQSSDTVKIVNIENNGTMLPDFAGPIPQAFFPGTQFAMDSSGYSVLVFEIFSRLFLYRYDPTFNLIWQDTILTGASGFPLTSDLVCYDSTFYLAARYYNDTLQIGNFTLLNPNVGDNSPSDNFLAKWSAAMITSVGEIENESIFIYPNPANDKIQFVTKSNINVPKEIKIYNAIGSEVYSKYKSTLESIDVSQFSNGLYFLKIKSGDVVQRGKFVKQ